MSLAVADTVIADPLTLAFDAGAVMDTVGAVLSTLTVTVEEVVVFPAASRATALSV